MLGQTLGVLRPALSGGPPDYPQSPKSPGKPRQVFFTPSALALYTAGRNTPRVFLQPAVPSLLSKSAAFSKESANPQKKAPNSQHGDELSSARGSAERGAGSF
jgi:hypothetical protein